jgi:dolichyl-phosphate-mannose-protein mannosyltransferase
MLRQGKRRAEMKIKPSPPASGPGAKKQSNQAVMSPASWSGVAVSMLFILAFIAQGLAFLESNSQTSDEAVHLAAGYSYLTRGDFRLNPEHPPFIKELCALSVLLAYGIPFQPDERLWSVAEEWRIGRDFLYRSPQPWERILFAGRLPNLLLGAVLVGLIGWWARRLWGDWAALTAMALAAFEPNLIANACLVTTDLGAALFTFLTLYLLWEYTAAPSWTLLIGSGLSMGLALASKYSTVVLVGIVAGVIGSYLLVCGGSFSLPRRKVATAKKGSAVSGAGGRIVGALAPFVLLCVVAALVIPVVYRFEGFSTWWLGLNRVLAHQEGGHQAFFLGEYSSQGWWSYFLVAFLIKTPVGTLALIVASLIFFRAGRPLGRRDLTFLLLPVVLLFLAASRGRINIGLRHVLPVYPFLIVLASRLTTLNWRFAARVAAVGIPVALTAASSLSVAPHQLAYFNELVGGPDNGLKYLSDSNIDWGQDLKGVKAYMDREGIPMIYLAYFGNPPPAALGIRFQYAPGFGHLEPPGMDTLPAGAPREILAISVCRLQGLFPGGRDLYAWLWDRPPVAKIGYSIYLYDLTSDAPAHLNLAKTYLRAGPQPLAAVELRKVLALDPTNSEAARLLSSLESPR